MKTRICIMRPGEPDEIQEHDLPREPGYEIIRDLIAPLLGGKGTYLERVAVLADFGGGDNHQPLDMFVDENGMLHQPRPPRNETATTHYRRATMMGRSGARKPADPEQLPFIVGVAVLFDRRVWF
jgi:hypothetical protein